MNRDESNQRVGRAQTQQFSDREQPQKFSGLPPRPTTVSTVVNADPSKLPPINLYPKNPENMSAEAVALLCLLHHPWRVNLWQGAVLSGFSEDELRLLIASGHLPVLNEGPGCTIYFSLPELREIMTNPDNVREFTRMINRFHRAKSAEKARRRAERGASGR